MENYHRNRQEHPDANRHWDENRIRQNEPTYGSPYDFRQEQEFNNPSRYNSRGLGSPEQASRYSQNRERYYGNLSDYEKRNQVRFPESGVNTDMRGVHAGKGPRSYKRSDERMKEMVCNKLCDDPYVDASDIEVEVNNCEVILSGNVEDRMTKKRAEEVAESIRGINHVENRIRVKQPGEGAATNG